MPIDDLKDLFDFEREGLKKDDGDSINDAFNEDSSGDESFDDRLSSFKENLSEKNVSDLPSASKKNDEEDESNGDSENVGKTDKDTILDSVPSVDDDFDTEDDLSLVSNETDPFASMDDEVEDKTDSEVKNEQEDKEDKEDEVENEDPEQEEEQKVEEIEEIDEDVEEEVATEAEEVYSGVEFGRKEQGGRWLLKSPESSLNEFYAAKEDVIRHILPGGEVPFNRYRQDMLDARVDMRTTYNQHELSDRMHLIQSHKDRLKEIQLHISSQLFKWDRAVEMLRGKLYHYKPTKPASAFDGVVYDHLRDMEFYYAELKGINTAAEQVSRTLDSAYNCLSRQVTITMPSSSPDRYAQKPQNKPSAAVPQKSVNYNVTEKQEVEEKKPDQLFDMDELEDFDEVDSNDQSNKSTESKSSKPRKALKSGLEALESLSKHVK